MLSNMNMNLLQVVGFGLRVQQGGKEYAAIVRLNERLFLAVDPTEKMPAAVRLVQADLAVSDGAPAPKPTGDPVQEAPAPKATDGTKKEEVPEKAPPPVNPVS